MEKMMNFPTLVSDKRTYEDIYLAETKRLTGHLNKVIDTSVEITTLLRAATLNIILNVLFGFRFVSL